jgi:glycosyltransferase involved in cell wall biosynthesis
VKVLYFTRGYSVHDRRFLNALAETDNTVHYLPILGDGFDRSRSELHSKIRLEAPLLASGSIHWLSFKGIIQNLRKHIGHIEPDLIHAGPIHLSATFAAMAGFYPLLSMSWGSDLLWETRKPWVNLAARYTLHRSDVFVGDCRAVGEAAIRFGMDKERIVLFPWGVDLTLFSPAPEFELRESLGWGDKFVLLSTRSFEPLYGVDLIIKSFIRIAHEYANIRLLLLGDGSQRRTFEDWLNDAGLMDRAHFAGMVDNHLLPAFYRSADIYVSASRSDGSSVSLMEALACGLPALVSDIPGNCEWVKPGLNGWHFRDGDLNSLISTLRVLLHEQDRLSELGEAARGIAEARANWVMNFPKLLEAYRLAMEQVGSVAS